MGLLLLFGVSLILPGLIDFNQYKGLISQKIKEKTGQDITINGNIQLSFFPTITVKLENIIISNNDTSFSSSDVVRVPEMQLSIELLPLLTKKVEINTLLLNNPTFFLEKNAAGVSNWQFPVAKRILSEKAEKSPSSNRNFSTAAPQISHLYIKNVIIKNATIRYKEGEKTRTLSDITAEFQLDKKNGKFDAVIALRVNNQLLEAEFGIGNIFLFVIGKPTTITIQASYGKKDFSLKASEVVVGNKMLVIPDMFIALDKISAKGNMSIDSGGDLPVIHAVLDVENLDMTPYMSSSPPPSVAAANIGKQPATSVNRNYWSDAPIDLSFSQKLEANILLSVDRLILKSLVIDHSITSIMLTKGKINIKGTDMLLYGGQGNVTIAVDTISQGAPYWNGDIKLNNIDAGRLLKEVASFKEIGGTADSKINFSSQGKNVQEIVSSLKGNGNIKLHNGVLRGINLALPPEKLVSLLSSRSHKEEETVFDSASGSFTIDKGIVRNEDFLLHTPLTDINGKGTVDLPNYHMQYRFIPDRASEFLGRKNMAVIMEGAINDPQITVDISEIIPSSPKDIKNTIGIIEDLKKNKKIKQEINRFQDMLKNIK